MRLDIEESFGRPMRAITRGSGEAVHNQQETGGQHA